MRAVLVCLFLFLAAPALAQDRSVYVWGNSLVHHPEQDRTNVPYWLGRLAAAEGRGIALDGQWTFLREVAEAEMAPQWGFDGVEKVGAADPGAYDAIVITPTNFIQYQSPEAEYDGAEGSPLSVTLSLLDRMREVAPEAAYLIFEGWADMGDYGYPPGWWAERRYHGFNRGDYHDWYVDYVEALRAARPEARITLIPVAPILSEIITGPLSDMEAEDFYLDDAPHGTQETYFLAALVTHAVLNDGPPPETFELPETLAPELRAAYPQIRALVWDRVQEMSDLAAAARSAVVAPAGSATDTAAAPMPDGAAEAPGATDPGSEAETAEAAETEGPDVPEERTGPDLAAIAPDDAPLPERREIDLPPRGARPAGAPALAMGLNGVTDWSSQHPFVDIMKTSRAWIGHLPGQWGGVGVEELRAGGHLDDHGWPVSIPANVERLETLILTDQPEAAEHLRGPYVLRYEGQGSIELTGRAQRVHYRDGEIRFHYQPGEGPVGISLSALDEDDPIREITVVQEQHLPLFEVGALFNPDWIARVQDMRVLRFMDWMMTNGSTAQGWDDRPRMEDATWTEWGVPLPAMIELANHVGADPWFTLPHRADDAYVRAFAEVVRDGLAPDLKAYVEYSNEVWNFIFPQAQWAQARAEERWGESGTGWMQFYGLRAAQIMDIWTEVFGGAASDRLVRVVSVHTGWPGLEEHVLTAPLAFLELGRPPQDSFDAYAVTGYFGHDVSDAATRARVQTWLDRSEAAARASGEAQGLSRVALREHVKAHRFEGALAPMETLLRRGAVATLTEDLFPYHAAAAGAAGLDLIMYEGGSHVTARAEDVEDARLTAFFEAFNYTPEMAGLYRDVLEGWTAAGGRLFNAFVDVSVPSKWGSWGALRHLDDANPRWDMLMAHNATAPVDWESRAAGAFDGGMYRRGTGRIAGGGGPDVLIGGPGDDVLVSNGGSDRLHGGAGRDRAELPGARGDYRFSNAGGRLVAERDGAAVILVAVEEMVFADAPGEVVPTN
ncbi:calcium-binding protein [Roseivivax sediminis]|uniref:Hemolysin-type calcium-binding repeat-containing protein n=1 Tax=Roseivivax sediminis TaxID=936889 RepID=A0A1I1ULE4_9RHOB|nr:calcium-binding protein [Roseivivax sediminis]SFD71631.1 hypothetical protein SAMN04515678_102407 [Roseivivax sediminis]